MAVASLLTAVSVFGLLAMLPAPKRSEPASEPERSPPDPAAPPGVAKPDPEATAKLLRGGQLIGAVVHDGRRRAIGTIEDILLPGPAVASSPALVVIALRGTGNGMNTVIKLPYHHLTFDADGTVRLIGVASDRWRALASLPPRSP